MTYGPNQVRTKQYKYRHRKATIPKALREQVWVQHAGAAFETKCCVTWCTNKITTFDFQVGHNIPESKGGTLALSNLRPICGRCNQSMGNRYTIDQWNNMSPAIVHDPCCVPIVNSSYSCLPCFR